MRKRFLVLLAAGIFMMGFSVTAQASSSLIITGVIDGPRSGGTPKAVELYVLADISDLSSYGLGSATNGGGSDGEEFTFSGAATAGDFLYVASESTEFAGFFGFAPDFVSGGTTGAAYINGDDAVELFMGSSVVDVFGNINVDGTGESWEYTDGWAYRISKTGPDGNIFNPLNWTFSGLNALDNEITNATSATPFPLGTYSPAPVATPVPPAILLLGSGLIGLVGFRRQRTHS